MKKYLSIFLRITIALLLVQTLRYKFTAHPDSVYIFSKLGLEPFGRIACGVIELIAAILILIPRTIWLGAAITIGVIGGAIVSHLTELGIQVKEDGGTLFYMAVLVFVLSLITLWSYRKNIPFISRKFSK